MTLDAETVCVAAMTLLLDKKAHSYQQVFKYLKDDMKITAPKVLYCDFEAGILRVAIQILRCSLWCCDIHWNHLLKDHISKSGLQSQYQTCPLFQHWVRKVWALALLPKEDITKVAKRFVLPAIPKLEELQEDEDSTKLKKRVLNQGMDPFILYLRRIWIG